MRLIYTGPHPEVVVDELDSDKVIVNGEPVNVPDELGARLLEQDTWQDAADDQSAAGKARKDQDKEQEKPSGAPTEPEVQQVPKVELPVLVQSDNPPQADDQKGNG